MSMIDERLDPFKNHKLLSWPLQNLLLEEAIHYPAEEWMNDGLHYIGELTFYTRQSGLEMSLFPYEGLSVLVPNQPVSAMTYVTSRYDRHLNYEGIKPFSSGVDLPRRIRQLSSAVQLPLGILLLNQMSHPNTYEHFNSFMWDNDEQGRFLTGYSLEWGESFPWPAELGKQRWAVRHTNLEGNYIYTQVQLFMDYMDTLSGTDDLLR